MSDAEYLRMTAAMEELRKSKMDVNVKGSMNVDEIMGLTRKVKDLRLVVIDYFGIIDPGQKGRASRTEYTTEISGKLKQMAKKLGVPVLLLAQLNREVEKRAEKRPQLSDLRETGALEQDADAVIFLHRPTYYGDRTQMRPWDPEDLQVIVAKNRHGAAGECKMACFMGVSKIAPGSDNQRAVYRQWMQNES
jgi:replicative DNA helicase